MIILVTSLIKLVECEANSLIKHTSDELILIKFELSCVSGLINQNKDYGLILETGDAGLEENMKFLFFYIIKRLKNT